MANETDWNTYTPSSDEWDTWSSPTPTPTPTPAAPAETSIFEAPKADLYKLYNVKGVFGANVDYTLGLKGSYVLGLSNSVVVGGYLCFYNVMYRAYTTGFRYTRVTSVLGIGSDTQLIDCSQYKTVTGKEIKQNYADKYEFFNANAYKYIHQKEYKIEGKAPAPLGATAAQSVPMTAGAGANTYNIIPYQNNYHTVFKNYTDESATVTAQKSITHETPGTLTQVSGGDMTIMAGMGGAGKIMFVNPAGDIGQQGKNVSITGITKLNLGSTTEVDMSAAGGYVTVKAGKVTIGPMLDLGIPGAIMADVQTVINQMAADLLQAQADAAAARLAAQSASVEVNILVVANNVAVFV